MLKSPLLLGLDSFSTEKNRMLGRVRCLPLNERYLLMNILL